MALCRQVEKRYSGPWGDRGPTRCARSCGSLPRRVDSELRRLAENASSLARAQHLEEAVERSRGLPVLGVKETADLRPVECHRPQSAIVLDDQLVQTDPRRLVWFRDVLRRTCLHAQVIVLTCRPEDYLESDELPNETPVRDLARGTIRAIDFARAAKRWTPAPSQSPTGGSERPRPRAPNTNHGAR
jgi:hypothetical protein